MPSQASITQAFNLDPLSPSSQKMGVFNLKEFAVAAGIVYLAIGALHLIVLIFRKPDYTGRRDSWGLWNPFGNPFGRVRRQTPGNQNPVSSVCWLFFWAGLLWPVVFVLSAGRHFYRSVRRLVQPGWQPAILAQETQLPLSRRLTTYQPPQARPHTPPPDYGSKIPVDHIRFPPAATLPPYSQK